MEAGEKSCFNCGGKGKIEGYTFPKSSPGKKRKIIVSCGLCGGSGKIKSKECENYSKCRYRIVLQETAERIKDLPESQKKFFCEFIETSCRSDHGYVMNKLVNEPLKCTYFDCQPCETEIVKCAQIAFTKKYDLINLKDKIMMCLGSPWRCIYSPKGKDRA